MTHSAVSLAEAHAGLSFSRRSRLNQTTARVVIFPPRFVPCTIPTALRRPAGGRQAGDTWWERSTRAASADRARCRRGDRPFATLRAWDSAARLPPATPRCRHPRWAFVVVARVEPWSAGLWRAP